MWEQVMWEQGMWEQVMWEQGMWEQVMWEQVMWEQGMCQIYYLDIVTIYAPDLNFRQTFRLARYYGAVW